jgi:hypothetical protein
MSRGACPTGIIGAMVALARLTAAALDLAFPAACSGCGREGRALCDGCMPALDARMDLPGGTPIGLPAELPAPLLQLDWCAPFAGPVRRALHDLKYAGERRLAEPLGTAVARRWARVGVGAEVVVPVPVHADREKRRGYGRPRLSPPWRPIGLPTALALGGARDGRPVRARARRARPTWRGFRHPAARGGAARSLIAGRWVLPRRRRGDDRVDPGSCAVALERAAPSRLGHRGRAGR